VAFREELFLFLRTKKLTKKNTTRQTSAQMGATDRGHNLCGHADRASSSSTGFCPIKPTSLSGRYRRGIPRSRGAPHAEFAATNCILSWCHHSPLRPHGPLNHAEPEVRVLSCFTASDHARRRTPVQGERVAQEMLIEGISLGVELTTSLGYLWLVIGSGPWQEITRIRPGAFQRCRAILFTPESLPSATSSGYRTDNRASLGSLGPGA